MIILFEKKKVELQFQKAEAGCVLFQIWDFINLVGSDFADLSAEDWIWMGFWPDDTEEYASEDLKKELRWIIHLKNSDVMNGEFLV